MWNLKGITNVKKGLNLLHLKHTSNKLYKKNNNEKNNHNTATTVLKREQEGTRGLKSRFVDCFNI